MRNRILKMSVDTAAVIFIVMLCMLDSDSYIPHVIAAVCAVYIGLFELANHRK